MSTLARYFQPLHRMQIRSGSISPRRSATHYWPRTPPFWPTRMRGACAVSDAARLADEKWDQIFGELIPTRAARASRASWPCPIRRDRVRAEHARFPSSPVLGPAVDRPARASHDRRRVPLRDAPVRAAGGRPPGRRASGSRPSRSTVFRALREPRPQRGHDLVFVSQVFFNSAATAAISRRSSPPFPIHDTLIVIDGYHGFMALPTDLSRRRRRACSILRAATNTPWRGRAPASCIARRAMRRGRATPAGSRRSARYRRADAAFPTATTAPASSARPSIRPGSTGSRRFSTGSTRSASPSRRSTRTPRRSAALPAAEISRLRPLKRRALSPRGDPPVGTSSPSRRRAPRPSTSDLLHGASITDVRGHRIRFGFGCYHTADEIAPAARRSRGRSRDELTKPAAAPSLIAGIGVPSPVGAGQEGIR